MKKNYNRYHMKKFFERLMSRGGVVGNKAVLLIYCPDAPEMSYILTEHIQ